MPVPESQVVKRARVIWCFPLCAKLNLKNKLDETASVCNVLKVSVCDLKFLRL